MEKQLQEDKVKVPIYRRPVIIGAVLGALGGYLYYLKMAGSFGKHFENKH